MLEKIGYIPALRSQLSSLFSLRLSSIEISSKSSLSGRICDLCGIKSFHSCRTLNKDMKKSYERIKSLKDKNIDDSAIPIMPSRMQALFPDQDLPTKVFNGIMFKDIPIVNIRVSPNNTIINLTDAKGVAKLIRSCGVEGFKNAKKGTNLAAQATGLTFGRKATDLGYKTVRVRIRGIGPGRMSTLRGIVMGGLDVISVTDNTRVTDQPRRGKKLRRI